MDLILNLLCFKENEQGKKLSNDRSYESEREANSSAKPRFYNNRGSETLVVTNRTLNPPPAPSLTHGKLSLFEVLYKCRRKQVNI